MAKKFSYWANILGVVLAQTVGVILMLIGTIPAIIFIAGMACWENADKLLEGLEKPE